MQKALGMTRFLPMFVAGFIFSAALASGVGTITVGAASLRFLSEPFVEIVLGAIGGALAAARLGGRPTQKPA